MTKRTCWGALALVGAISIAAAFAWPAIAYRQVPVLMTGFSAPFQVEIMTRGSVKITEESFRGSTIVGTMRVSRFSGKPAGRYTLWYPETGTRAIECFQFGPALRNEERIVTVWHPDGTVGATSRQSAPYDRASPCTPVPSTSPLFGKNQDAPSAPWRNQDGTEGNRELLDWLESRPEAQAGAELPMTHRSHLRPF